LDSCWIPASSFLGWSVWLVGDSFDILEAASQVQFIFKQNAWGAVASSQALGQLDRQFPIGCRLAWDDMVFFAKGR
jgi:hypothetical protein